MKMKKKNQKEMLMKLLKVMKVAGPTIVIPLAKKVFTELEPKMIYSVGINSRPQQRLIAKYFKISTNETFGTTDKNGQSDIDIVPSDFPQQPLSVYKLMDGIVMRFRVHIHQTHTYERCFMYVECLNIQSHREKLDKFIHESYRAADRDMSDIYNEKNGTTKIFFTGNPVFKYRKLRSFDDVFIKDDTEKEIKDNLDNFTNSRDWYREHNIPYHFGIMLYGPPGTGKTSLVQAICHYLHAVPFYVDPGKMSRMNCLIDDIQNEVPDSRPIVKALIFEDIDYIIDLDQMKYDYSTDNDKTTSATSTDDSKVVSKISDVLNSLDGIGACENVVYIFTTNNYSKFFNEKGEENALIRPGRIDLKIEIPNVDNEVLEKFLKSHYGDDVTIPQDFKIKDGVTCSQLQLFVMNKMSCDDIIKKVQKVNHRKGSVKNETSSN